MNGFRTPSCLYLADRCGMDRAATCGIGREAAEEQVRQARQSLAAATAGLQGVRIVDPLDDLCDARTCVPYAGETILFSDTNYMSEQGIGWLIPRHRAEFDWLVGGGS